MRFAVASLSAGLVGCAPSHVDLPTPILPTFPSVDEPSIVQRSETVVSPVGPISRSAAWSFCSADHLVVGTVQAVRAFHPNGAGIMSDLTIAVERDLKNSAGPTLSFMVPGGRMDGVIQTNSDTLPPTSGLRYLLAIQHLSWQPVNRPWKQGDPYVGAFSLHSSDLALPSTAELASDWVRFCEGL